MADLSETNAVALKPPSYAQELKSSPQEIRTAMLYAIVWSNLSCSRLGKLL